MRLGVLFSGGKDSTLALHRAAKDDEVVCLISISSRNEASYMFHTPNIWLTEKQAEELGLPLVNVKTQGQKEEELAELKDALQRAIDEYQIQGVVTGAVESVYQSSRIQKICDELGLWCFNPLWLMDQLTLLRELVDRGYLVLITGVFAFPLGEEWLGRIIDNKAISELEDLQSRYKLNPAGEGGEIETTVLDAPMFRRKIIIKKSSKEFKDNAGVMRIEEVGYDTHS